MPPSDTPAPPLPDIWLCLSGGAALGAFQAGFCEMLAEQGVEPRIVTGTSVGAIVGALMAGNPPDRRSGALRSFLQAARQQTPAELGFRWGDLPQRRWTLMRNLIGGHPGLFRPRVSGLVTAATGLRRADHLYDRSAMRRLLESLIDLDLLNSAALPFAFTALDGETAEVLNFDTRRQPVTIAHLMAASAVPVMFAPERIDGRVLVDAGFRVNLPLHLLAAEPAPRAVACLAVDLFPAAFAPYPDSLSGVSARAQDIFFAGQSLDAIERFTTSGVQGEALRLIHVVHDDPNDETAGKALDFAGHVLTRRWERGRTAAEGVLDGLRGKSGATSRRSAARPPSPRPARG